MNAKTRVKSETIFDKLASLAAKLVEKPVQAKSPDYGFDHNEAELAAGLHAPPPKDRVQPDITDVSAAEVENSSLYLF